MSANNILLGTSGWSYKEWEGSFYKKVEKHKLRLCCMYTFAENSPSQL